jgi:hypothetical protein
MEGESMASDNHNHRLKTYRERATGYWRKARDELDPFLKAHMRRRASIYQELASIREHHLAVLRRIKKKGAPP